MSEFIYSMFSQSEKWDLFYTFFYKSPVMQVFVELDTGKILDVNDRFCSFYGYTREELTGRTFIEMNIMNNLTDKEYIKHGVISQGGVYDIELLERTKYGDAKWVNVSVSRICILGTNYLLGVGIDITQRKMIEFEIQRINNELEKRVKERTQEIRHFTEYLHLAQEEERTRISREIHDDLGQQLIGVKMGLVYFKKKYADKEELSVRLNKMIEDVEGAILSMRKIIAQLRPGILDTLGLIPSISWLAKEFEEKTGIKCELKLLSAEREYEKKFSTCFFRICQEALNNAAKHSNATQINITLREEGNKLILSVRDNGRGMSVGQITHPFSFGIIGMRERASLINGEIEITSEENKGTTVQLKADIKDNSEFSINN